MEKILNFYSFSHSPQRVTIEREAFAGIYNHINGIIIVVTNFSNDSLRCAIFSIRALFSIILWQIMFSHIAEALQLGLVLKREFLSSQLGYDIWLLERQLSPGTALLV